MNDYLYWRATVTTLGQNRKIDKLEKSKTMSFRNPILPGFNPDPSIIYVRPFYYLATSTFQFFPGVPIYRSPDLINWTLTSHALNRRSQLDMRTVEGGGGIFAPTLRWNKGRFYMTTCCTHRIRFGTTDVSPSDPW
jgi:beta-xylosidase